MKLSTAAPSLTQTVLVYGPPKVGKTKLVGALSERYNLLWFDLEKGVETLRQFPVPWQERVDLISIPDTRSYPIAIETCLKVIKGGPCNLCVLHCKMACPLCTKASAPFHPTIELNKLGRDTIVVFDSLTQLTNSAIAHITKSQPDDYKLTYDDWAHLGKLMDTFLSHVQQAPFNVVCVSHETEAEMEDGKLKIVPTAGTRNFSRNSAKYFGHVIYANVVATKHKFSSSTTAVLNTVMGSRSNVAVETMAEASLLPIFDSPQLTNQTNGQIAASRLAGLTGEKK